MIFIWKKIKIKMTLDRISNIGYWAFWSTFCKMGYKAIQLPSNQRKIVLKGMAGSVYTSQ